MTFFTTTNGGSPKIAVALHLLPSNNTNYSYPPIKQITHASSCNVAEWHPLLQLTKPCVVSNLIGHGRTAAALVQLPVSLLLVLAHEANP